MKRTCQQCSGELRWDARSHAKFCSNRCRVAAHRGRKQVPAELREVDRWVRHDKKRPIQSDGSQATSTDESTWTDYESAAKSNIGDGVGFVLNGDGIVCVDLDHCIRPDGTVERWAKDIVDSMPGTYMEVSMSGTGIHIFGYANVGRGRNFGNGVEVYGNGRYIAVTGNRFGDAPAALSAIDGPVRDLVE